MNGAARPPDSILTHIAYRLRPEIREMGPLERAGALIDVFTLVWTAPLALLGLLWLVASTNTSLLRREWLVLLILLGLGLLMQRITFSLRLELQRGVYARIGGSLVTLVHWSAALLFGPTAVWLPVIEELAQFVYAVSREDQATLRWNHTRDLSTNLAGETISNLTGLWVYVQLGGHFPLNDVGLSDFWPALVASLVVWLMLVLLSSVVLFYVVRQEPLVGSEGSTVHLAQFFLAGLSFFVPIYPFAILGAGLYSQHGIGIYLLFVVGALMFSLVANRLSASVQRSEQRTRELARLEKLGEAIINTPPTETDARLPALLDEFVLPMLPDARFIAIWLSPDTFLLRSSPLPVAQWDRIATAVTDTSEEFVYFGRLALPGQRVLSVPYDGIGVPIHAADGQTLGGIFVVQRASAGSVQDFVPALQSLASQIALALQRADTYRQMVAGERMARELEVAGHIQASFLPDHVPQPDGWDIAAALFPARETSGDFYDFIDLDHGRLGILVADVADKGTGAALYMALSRTLIRTFAMQHPDQPARALALANTRILSDTQSEQFVTVLYGVLALESGTLTYCNAGHNPAYLFRAGGDVERLVRTGIPLGMFEEMAWQQETVALGRGEPLVLYTDGVPEAQDGAGDLFEDARLLTAVQGLLPAQASTIRDGIVTAVQTFTDGAPQSDDITLLVIARR